MNKELLEEIKKVVKLDSLEKYEVDYICGCIDIEYHKNKNAKLAVLYGVREFYNESIKLRRGLRDQFVGMKMVDEHEYNKYMIKKLVKIVEDIDRRIGLIL